MREFWRSLRTVVALSFRADAVRSAVVLLPVQALGVGATAWAGREVLDGAVSGDRPRFWTGVVIEGVAALAWISLALLAFQFDMRLRERLGVVIDEQLIDTVSAIPTLDHHQHPEIADKLELLRTRRSDLLSVIGALANVANAVGQVVVASVLLATVDPFAALLPVFGVPLVLAARRAAAIRESMAETSAEDERRMLHLFDLSTRPAAAKEIRVFGLEDHLADSYHRQWVDLDRRYLRVDIRGAALVASGGLVLTAAFAAVLLVIADRARRGAVTPGDLLLTLGLLTSVGHQVRGFAMLSGWVSGIAITAGRLVAVQDHAAAVDAAGAWTAEPVSLPDRITEGIRLDGVTARYPGADSDALRHVDLVLPAGTTVAVVGDNGAGKSTLVGLLCGFHRPVAGTVTVDGVDLAQFEPREWRDRIAASFQDFTRFELVAHEVVGVGDVGRLGDLGHVDEALRRAAATDVVAAMAHGLETPLGASMDGADLSGGQWQKLALGRAMARAAPLLLVLDEPTASLDAETEHALFDRYAAAAGDHARQTGAITVLVSHRFSTVREADLIVVVANGAIAETGSHAELRARGGTYAELYDLQAGAYR